MNDETPRFLSNDDIDNVEPGEIAQPMDWSEPADIFSSIPFSDGTLPEGLMPASIDAYARAKGAVVGVWPGPIACALLVAAAQALPHNVKIRPNHLQPRWLEQAILWFGNTGPSGVNKSIPPEEAGACYSDLDKKLLDDYKRDLAEYIKAKAKHAEAMKTWRKECKGIEDPDNMPDPPEAPEAPILVKNVINDATTERLIELCAANPRGVIQVEDELTRMLGAMGAYSGTSGRDQAVYNKAYSGQPSSVDRMTRTTYAERVAVCLVGAITEDALSQAFRGKPRDGFIARFLFAYSDAVDAVQLPEDPELRNIVHRNIRAIMDMNTKSTGFNFTMSPEANDIRVRLRQWRVAVQKLDTTGPYMREWLGKWDGMFARLCLVFKAYENAEAGRDQFENSVVDEGTALRVEALMKRYFLPEAMRLFTNVLGDNSDARGEYVQWIGHWILAGDKERISVRDIGRDYRDWKKLDSRQQEQVMISLETAGWIERHVSGRARLGGEWAKTKWNVNPQVHKMFEERAKAERALRDNIISKIREGRNAIKELVQG